MAFRKANETDETGAWLTVDAYGKKYGLSRGSVYNFTRRDKVKYKHGTDYNKTIYVLDVPLDQQPVKNKVTPRVRAHSARKPPVLTVRESKAVEQRQADLRTIYLPIFLEKAPPGKMTFTGEDLVKILDIADTTLYVTWRRWGLQPKDIPSAHRDLNDKMGTAQKYYYLRDVYRFLSGEFEPAEKGTLDDVLIGAAEDRTSLDGEYYKYDEMKVYPRTGEGVLAWIEDMDIMREDKRLNKWTKFIPWEAQREFIRNAFSVKENGDYNYNLILISCPRGEGKSLKKGTKIIYLDGSVGKVEDVKVGDLLMGPGSTPRKVLALGSGKEEMFEITPLRGEPFVCNKSHILALKYRKEVYLGREGKRSIRKNEIIDITMHLEDFLKKGPDFRSRCMLYRVPVDWPEKPVNVDPYYLGLWLSDGGSHGLSITESVDDVEIFDFLREFAGRYGCELSLYRDKRSKGQTANIPKGNSKQLRQAMEGYGLFGNKHIPLDYKANSRTVRLRLLAGLLDGDGGRNRNSIEFTMKSKRLVEDIAFLARSLGFHAEIRETVKGIKSTGFKGTYYRIGISGDCSVIPNLVERKKCPPRKHTKNILYSGIKEVRSLGEGEYYGFVLDGDHLYLLEDFTVTHNTYVVALLALFRFYNHFGEVINLSGNSKDQVSFAHYDLCKKIIQNTPRLKNTPGLVVKEKYIALMAGPKETVCQIKAIPTSTGLLPGTTCAVFTELHNLEERKFFIDLWTSTRATPNAMVLVDTTVAEPGHIVYELWESFLKKEDPLLYFYHYADKHYNPETTPEQLNSFKRHMLEAEYNRYFRNRWEDASGGVFTPDKIKAISLYGVDGVAGQSIELHAAINGLLELESKRNTFEKGKFDLGAVNHEIAEVERRFMHVDNLYKAPATPDDLDLLSKVFGCGLIVGVGLDRAQMVGIASDRTVLTCVARGIVSSELSYYFILDMFIPKESTLTALVEKILEWTALYGWLDKIAIESPTAQDFYFWCIEHAYEAEMIYPSFKAQKPVFTALYQLIEQGHLKAPRIPYYTDEEGTLYRGHTNRDDIFRDELKVFSYKVDKWFGSPQKRRKGGVKDDTIYSLAWAIYATQGEMTPVGGRGGLQSIGGAVKNRDVIGDYR